MKPVNFYPARVSFFFVILFLSGIGGMKAQNLLKYGVTPVQTNYIDHDGSLEFGAGNLGIGLYPAKAQLHVCFTGSPTQPVFKTELKSPFSNEENASIEYFVTHGLNKYAIYQTDSAEMGLLNYFQDPIKIGDIKISNDLTLTTFETISERASIDFKMWTSAAEARHPLTILPHKVIVGNIQITSDPGIGKILASDIDGNGKWTDASLFNDQDWLETEGKSSDETGPPPPGEQKSIYANTKYKNVGIGTMDPLSKLHIVDGNILISTSKSKAPGSINGSILFGEVVTTEWPLGEWGIEYERLGDDYATGGLNFWKVASANNAGADNCLFLKNNGNIGIGTSSPADKFQVNDKVSKLCIGNATLDVLAPGTSYLGYNAARSRGKEVDYWVFESNGQLNGGNITCGDVDGNYHIISVPSSESGSDKQKLFDDELTQYIRVTVTKDGDVGIGTTSTHGYKLAVNGKVLCTNLKVQLEGEWPDYVFRKEYPLLPLNEVENYIVQNNHLPGIPSSVEMHNNGIDVSMMNSVLVTKIEELTRYIIDQQKQLEKQQQQIEELMRLQKSK